MIRQHLPRQRSNPPPWERLGKDPGALLRGSLLDEALRYERQDLNELENEFLQASQGLQEREKIKKEEQTPYPKPYRAVIGQRLRGKN